jgi:hypothetical protein
VAEYGDGIPLAPDDPLGSSDAIGTPAFKRSHRSTCSSEINNVWRPGCAVCTGHVDKALIRGASLSTREEVEATKAVAIAFDSTSDLALSRRECVLTPTTRISSTRSR